jgi:hypothetical protein
MSRAGRLARLLDRQPPSAYRCGGSSGWAMAGEAGTLLIPVELSRLDASTSTNGGDDTRRARCGRAASGQQAGGPLLSAAACPAGRSPGSPWRRAGWVASARSSLPRAARIAASRPGVAGGVVGALALVGADVEQVVVTVDAQVLPAAVAQGALSAVVHAPVQGAGESGARVGQYRGQRDAVEREVRVRRRRGPGPAGSPTSPWSGSVDRSRRPAGITAGQCAM